MSTDQTVTPEETADPYAGRYLGRTKAQKEREVTIRDAERSHWISVFSRLGDGRLNRKIPKDQREVYRKVSAMISQNRED